jgi:integrase
LKGVHTVKAKGKTYHYAWIGGPRLSGAPGSPQFHASYNEAIETRRLPEPGKFRSVITLYKANDAYTKLAESTRKNWGPWLDRIADHFGDLSIAQFDRPQKIRLIIVRWRGQWSDKPRTADYGLQILSVVLSFAVDPLGKIAGNPVEGIKQLYKSNRSGIIWTDVDIARLKKSCSKEISHAVDLAASTGLREGDLVRLSWSHIVEDKLIRIATSKSRRSRDAIIPLYGQLRAVLASIPKRSTTVLTNSKGLPWSSAQGLASAFYKAKLKAGMKDRDLNFHDLRGTAATKFYVAGLGKRVIAEVLGWSEDQVEGIIHRYVDRNAATEKFIRLMDGK